MGLYLMTWHDLSLNQESDSTMQLSKERNLAICNDVDGTRGYYAERNKSVRERQLSYDLSDMRNLRVRAGGRGG